jgi:hypothetical protein
MKQPGGRIVTGMGAALMGLSLVAMAITASAATTTPVHKPLRLEAFAVDLGGIGRLQAERLNIVIEKWSSDAERDGLINTLESKGREALFTKLQSLKPRAGYISTDTSLGWDILYAQQFQLPDGSRKIIFATDRPMSFIERINGGRSVDYQFILCEIHLDSSGRGVGKLASKAKVTYNKAENQIEVEDYNFAPVRLTDVQLAS